MTQPPDTRPAGTIPRLRDRLKTLGSLLAPPGHRASLRRLEAQLREQEAVIAAKAEALAFGQKIFNRAAEAARIGVWQCSLPDETLLWTDVVYDLFDLDRKSVV